MSSAVEATASSPSSRTRMAHFWYTSWIFKGSDAQLPMREKSARAVNASFIPRASRASFRESVGEAWEKRGRHKWYLEYCSSGFLPGWRVSSEASRADRAERMPFHSSAAMPAMNCFSFFPSGGRTAMNTGAPFPPEKNRLAARTPSFS